jgi:acyl-CoA thioester hydrolase
MARIKIVVPAHFSFSTAIPVRITDINYGGHLGNDALLSLLHEARLRFLQHHGYSELDLATKGLILADAAIEYKGESFHGDVLTIFVAADDFNKYGFDLVYKVLNQHGKAVALAKTGMVCFDYKARRIAALPVEAAARLVGEKPLDAE